MIPRRSFTVQADPRQRRDCPLRVLLPAAAATSASYYVVQEGTDRGGPAQISQGEARYYAELSR